MFLRARPQNFTPLIFRVAKALGVSTDVIAKDYLERAVLDMGVFFAPIHHHLFVHKCNVTLEIEPVKRIAIQYSGSPIVIEILVDSYTRLFPESEPCTGKDNTISFLFDPFMEKILPTLKLFRTHPEALAKESCHFVDASTRLLSSTLQPGYGFAVYLSGEAECLGNWKTASRLDYDNETQSWNIRLPKELVVSEFKFLIGSFDENKKRPTSELHYQEGKNQAVLVHEVRPSLQSEEKSKRKCSLI